MDNYKSLLSGFISGAVHTVVGHPFDTIKTFKQNNILIQNNNLFKGLLYPLIQISIINAIAFSSNHYLKKYNDKTLSNFYTGIISSIVCTPLDKYKIMNQYSIPYKISFKNIKNSFKQTHIVTLRELPGTFIYFSTYDKLISMNHSIFFSGSIAGIISWFFTYPIDTIKTRLQSNRSKTIKEAISKGNLLKGLSFCLVRAGLVNGINFKVYDYCMKNI